ncbi:hypothetical protein ACFOYW_16885 [Gryllotalpicola reticulitermitis]|uniref:DUF222 domain-containing protein n=1 Tax=Gryllotalpicola reticulitermitis TaxID=1184153 RepID=A0ABV8QBZ3_9MICO
MRAVSVLDATLEEWQLEALAGASHAATVAHIAAEQERMLEELDEAMKASMSAEADNYLDTLRPQFDHAADLARVLNAAGVIDKLQKPGAKEIATKQDGKVTVETIPAPTDLEYVTEMFGAAAGAAWAEFIDDRQIDALHNAAALRATLAELLNIGEGRAPHSIGIGASGDHFAPRYGEPDYVKWLRLAPSLQLVPFKDTTARP